MQRGGHRCDSQIVVRLKIHPELRRHAKVFAQAEGDIGADGPLPAHDLVDAGKVEKNSRPRRKQIPRGLKPARNDNNNGLVRHG